MPLHSGGNQAFQSGSTSYFVSVEITRLQARLATSFDVAAIMTISR